MMLNILFAFRSVMPKDERSVFGRTDSEQKSALATRRRIYIRGEGAVGDRAKSIK